MKSKNIKKRKKRKKERKKERKKKKGERENRSIRERLTVLVLYARNKLF